MTTTPMRPARVTCSRPAPIAPGIEVRVAASWSDLTDDVVAAVGRACPPDPFTSIEVIVRGAAARRALSQVIATRTGPASAPRNGICAGIEFPTLAQVHRRVQGDLGAIPPDRDPWRRRPLTLTVLGVLRAAGDEPWYQPLAHHLSPGAPTGTGERRPGRWLATSDRIARLLLGYVREAPDMLRAWSRGDDRDPAGVGLPAAARWQPEVWRACRTALAPVDDPVTRHDLLLADPTRAALTDVGPAGLLIADPGPMPAFDHEFLAALARIHPVTVFTLTPAGSATPWGRRLGASARGQQTRFAEAGALVVPVGTVPPSRRVDTVLHRLQADLVATDHPSVAGVPHAPDGSVQVHASHGPDRQVEVLRDVLCGLFVERPDLEPRDVVVICPRLDDYAPLVRAAFGGPGSAGAADDDPVARGTRHPGTRLRVQVAATAVEEPNPAFPLLRLLLTLPVARAGAGDFVDLCASPLVAARFALEPDDLLSLARLLEQAGTRWGVDSAHRDRFGLHAVRQSTWLAGIDRMLVGVALADEPPGWLDTVIPVAQVSSRHLPVIGAAAEILSRVRLLNAQWDTPAPLHAWSDRLIGALDLLTAATDGDSARILAHARAELATLAELTGDSHVPVSRADLTGHFDRLVHTGSGRPNHGNGSLLVTRPDDLDDVAHRVVVVLGLDDATVPPPIRHDGDNLVPDRSLPVSGQRASSLRFLHEAVAAAIDTLVVIHQGRDPRSNETVPVPPVLAELVDACAGIGGITHRDHTLLPESATNFVSTDDEPPVSFDPVALRGARALDGRLRDERAPTRAPGESPATPLVGPVPIDDLIAFFRNPARALLRHHLGVSLDSFTPELDDNLPVEADGLVRWRIGSALLDAELQGLDVDRAEHAQAMSGILPPPGLAGAVINDVRARADRVAAAVRERISSSSGQLLGPRPHRVRIDLAPSGPGPLTGEVITHGDTVVSWRYGAVRWQELVPLWIRLLALRAAPAATAATPPAPRALAIGTNGIFRLTPPDPVTARTLLAEMAGVRGRGLSHVLPLPVEIVNARRPVAAHSPDTPDRRVEQEWTRLAERPEWQMTLPLSFRALMALPPEADDPGPSQPSRVDQLTGWLTAPIFVALTTERLP